MTRADDTALINLFEEFYQSYYQEDSRSLTMTSTSRDGFWWWFGQVTGNQLGCYLCRECHDCIHQGEANISNPDWLVHCVENLVTAYLQYHDGDEEPDVKCIVERYNLPDVDVLVHRFVETKKGRY